MVDFQYMERYDIQDLRRIMALLRAPGGCPWDREQTHESIRRNMLEEAYEVVEAIDEQDPEHLKEELGDVLLQVVFHAQMAREEGLFTFDDSATPTSLDRPTPTTAPRRWTPGTPRSGRRRTSAPPRTP